MSDYFDNAAKDCAEIMADMESYSEGKTKLLSRIAVLLAVACDELDGIRRALNAGRDDGK